MRQARRPAHRIDFEAALGMPHADLRDLGARIERARDAADPVRLALLALELRAWEAASQKEAALTAATLREEAAMLATQRRRSAELRALIGLYPELAARPTPEGVSMAELAVAVATMETDDRGAKGQVGNKVSIHHIQMEQIGTCHLHVPDFISQPREISRQERWGHLNQIDLQRLEAQRFYQS
jgi:hypothetical protein